MLAWRLTRTTTQLDTSITTIWLDDFEVIRGKNMGSLLACPVDSEEFLEAGPDTSIWYGSSCIALHRVEHLPLPEVSDSLAKCMGIGPAARQILES